jgi:hypothetical protein
MTPRLEPWLGRRPRWPGVVTVALVHLGGTEKRDYVFVYLGLVAVLGVLGGLWPSVAAALSFLLVDFFFVPPVGTLTIADEQDIVNLLAFVATAGIVGLLASHRRRLLLEARALAQSQEPVRALLLLPYLPRACHPGRMGGPSTEVGDHARRPRALGRGVLCLPRALRRLVRPAGIP